MDKNYVESPIHPLLILIEATCLWNLCCFHLKAVFLFNTSRVEFLGLNHPSTVDVRTRSTWSVSMIHQGYLLRAPGYNPNNNSLLYMFIPLPQEQHVSLNAHSPSPLHHILILPDFPSPRLF